MRLSLAALHKKERPDKHQVGAKTVSEPYCHHSPNHSGGSTARSRFVAFFPQARAFITAIHSTTGIQCAIEPQSDHQFFQYNDARMT